MDLQLQGKSVLITGASQGIGEGLALAFAQEGSHLHLVARSESKLEAIAQRVRSEHGVSAEILPLDTSPRSGYTSGTIITVDGGITSKRSVT